MDGNDKRELEVRVVRLLNGAGALGLIEISAGDDPPDVTARVDGHLVGIEVSASIEWAKAKSQSLMNSVVLPVAARLAAAAAPGEVKVGFEHLDIASSDRAKLEQLGSNIAEVVRALAAFAPVEGMEAVTMSALLRESARKLPSEGPRLTIHDEIRLPFGVNYVWFVRAGAGPLVLALGSWIEETIPGPGLDEVEQRINDKRMKLPRWRDQYDERWLVIPCPGFFSRTSVQQAKESGRRYPNTGFDRIYLIDNSDERINLLRLDR